MERWAFWKNRLTWVSEQTDSLLEITTTKAMMLVRCMDDIERVPQTDLWKGWIEEEVKRDNFRRNYSLY